MTVFSNFNSFDQLRIEERALFGFYAMAAVARCGYYDMVHHLPSLLSSFWQWGGFDRFLLQDPDLATDKLCSIVRKRFD